MKKIFFNDKYALTDAVLQGHKTMTRQIIRDSCKYDKIVRRTGTFSFKGIATTPAGNAVVDILFPNYEVGEVVAVAQSYKKADPTCPLKSCANCQFAVNYERSAGCDNKMFARADLMPHQILITNIRVERLQDISDADCRREGIVMTGIDGHLSFTYYDNKRDLTFIYPTPTEAFAELIDKVGKNGTWKRNPWAFAYEFELVK